MYYLSTVDVLSLHMQLFLKIGTRGIITLKKSQYKDLLKHLFREHPLILNGNITIEGKVTEVKFCYLNAANMNQADGFLIHAVIQYAESSTTSNEDLANYLHKNLPNIVASIDSDEDALPLRTFA